MQDEITSECEKSEMQCAHSGFGTPCAAEDRDATREELDRLEQANARLETELQEERDKT